MRILTIGLPLPNREIDNHNLANAPTFFDYDVVIVNPFAVSQFIEDVVRGEGDYRTTLDEPVYDGPTVAGSAGLADLIRHRRGELQRHLDAGGIVVCLAYPNAAHSAVGRFPGCDRYAWLPSSPDVDWSRDAVLPGFGTEVVVTDFEHPFASFIDSSRDRLAYRAYLSDNVRGPVFARSAGGAPIAQEAKMGAGTLVFLPALRDISGGTDRIEVADALVESCRKAAADRVHVGQPEWVEQFSVPGLDEELAGLRDAELVLEAATSQVAEFDVRVERLARYRGLLWQVGRLGLEPLVREALTMIGFTPVSGESEPIAVRDGSDTVFVEVEGSVAEVDLAPHYRLRRRWESELVSTGEPRRGLVVINGLKDLRPEFRQRQHADSLRVAAESMRYCVMNSSDLFEMVCVALQGASADQLTDFRNAILHTEGFLPYPVPSSETPAGHLDAEPPSDSSEASAEVAQE